ncbi:MAG: tripartite tricarboxylate transporter TctB family protein [Deltaproteobacteria bacterium]|nr:tripartite tricarboxylate transporter TctB family protein [Deltaproteobacteria bacterium]
MKKADMLTGIVLLVLAGGVIWGARQMPQSATFGPGPGFLPLWVGVILALLAFILLASAWTRKLTQKDTTSPFPGAKALLAITGVLGGLAAYILLIEVLGFLADTFLYVAFLLGIVERERWQVTLGVAVLTTASLYIVFQVLLGITLPSNMFGF